jgi:hypothetical protein
MMIIDKSYYRCNYILRVRVRVRGEGEEGEGEGEDDGVSIRDPHPYSHPPLLLNP